MPYRKIRTEGGPLDGPFLDDFKLWVAVPSTDTWLSQFGLCLLQLNMQLLTNHVGNRTFLNVQNMCGSMLTLNRENMIRDALEHDEGVTHILMLDSDMTFPADVAHWLAWRNEPIVAANYVKRTVPTVPIARDLNGKLLATLDTSTGLQPVRYAGLGCCMVHREVFEKVPEPWFSFDWVRDPKCRGGWGVIGEDVSFFDKCRAAGYDVLLDHDLSKYITHIGGFEYTHRMAFLDEEEGVYSPDGTWNPETKLEWLKKKEQELKDQESQDEAA